MKIILYSFIEIFVFGILRPAFTTKTPKQNTILLQATDSNPSAQQLEKSVKIISGRLADFSSEKFEVTVVPGKNQIRVSASNITDLETVEGLLTPKGEMAFYETLDRPGWMELLKGDSTLFSFFEKQINHRGDARLGCISETGIAEVNGYLEKRGPISGCRLVWDRQDPSSNCLYALKVNGEKGAVVASSEIESVKYNQDKAARYNEILVKLKPSAITLWEEVTRRNIDHSIAIVLDNKVLAAPVVRSVISGGNCMITGNYTPNEARLIAVVGNNGELPLNFSVVK